MQACQAGFFHLAICFYKRASQVGLVAKILPANVGDIRDAGLIPLEEGMAIHSSILAGRIPWTEEPSSLQSVGRKESDTTAATD